MQSSRKSRRRGRVSKLNFILIVLASVWALYVAIQLVWLHHYSASRVPFIVDDITIEENRIKASWRKPLVGNNHEAVTVNSAQIQAEGTGTNSGQNEEEDDEVMTQEEIEQERLATLQSTDDDDGTAPETRERNRRIANVKNITLTCGCPHFCDAKILDKGNEFYTCNDRIKKFMIDDALSEQEACTVASVELGEKVTSDSNPCSAKCNPKHCTKMVKKPLDCGCPHVCDQQALYKRVPHVLCNERIQYMIDKYDISEEEACEASSEDEPFQNSDKPCEIECNPKFCKDMKEKPKLDITGMDMNDPPFQRYEGVVIVTKVLWSKDLPRLKQMFCLLNAAYNRHVHYDLLVFTTLPWSEREVKELQEIASPAKLTVALEGPSLEDHIANMTMDEVQFLEKRCNVTHGEKLTWFHRCAEDNSHLYNNLGYSWQAEFRAYHIWNHPAMLDYKYMFWIDADAMATMTFKTDPMKVFIENDLNLMFDHFPGGLTRLPEVKTKMMGAYGKSICKISLNKEDGTLEPEFCKEGKKPSVRQVYGFNHITRLDMYRKESHQKFLKSLVSDYKFSRKWDDQLAVTVPAVMEDPKKVRDHRLMGVVLGLHHNTFIDGKDRGKYLSYTNWWANIGKTNWTVARSMCDGLVVDLG